jgi:hypothetical protein
MSLLLALASTGDATPGLGPALAHEAELLVRGAEREVREQADLAVVYAEADRLRQALSGHREATAQDFGPDRSTR